MVCPDCGMTTWDAGFGCRLPGCENYGVLADDEQDDGRNQVVAE